MGYYKLLMPIQSRTKSFRKNCFLANTGIVPILNFTPETIQSGLKDRLLVITSVIGLKPTYLTTKSGKWIAIVKKLEKTKQDKK